jgi:hypothetical protein
VPGLLVAALVALAGLGLLRAHWAGRLAGVPGTRAAAWAILGGAGIAASVIDGVAHGIPIAAGAITVLAWLLIGATVDARARRADRMPRAGQPVAPPRAWLRECGRLVVVVGLCGMVAATATLASGRLLFTGAPAVLAWTILSFPLLWGALATFALVGRDPRSVFGLLGALGAGAGLVLAA